MNSFQELLFILAQNQKKVKICQEILVTDDILKITFKI